MTQSIIDRSLSKYLACLLCRMHGAVCSSASTLKQESCTTGIIQASILVHEESLSDSSHVVGPILARDAQIFEQYLPSTDQEAKSSGLRSSVDPFLSYKPIYHTTLPRRRPSPSNCDCSRNRKTEWLNVIEPFAEKLLTLYGDSGLSVLLSSLTQLATLIFWLLASLSSRSLVS